MEDRDFAAWLSEELRLRKWSQADFARASGFTTGTISRWMTGNRVPDPESCDQIADVLGVDVDLVLTMAGHRPALEPLEEGSIEAELVSLIRRVQWNDERASGIRLILRNYIEFDRQRSKEGD